MIQPRIPETLQHDPGWRAALYIFGRLFHDHAGVWSFVNIEQEEIDFDRMLEAGWSSAERLALQCAQSLFNGDALVRLDDVAARLDDNFFDAVLMALAAYRSPMRGTATTRPPFV